LLPVDRFSRDALDVLERYRFLKRVESRVMCPYMAIVSSRDIDSLARVVVASPQGTYTVRRKPSGSKGAVVDMSCQVCFGALEEV